MKSSIYVNLAFPYFANSCGKCIKKFKKMSLYWLFEVNNPKPAKLSFALSQFHIISYTFPNMNVGVSGNAVAMAQRGNKKQRRRKHGDNWKKVPKIKYEPFPRSQTVYAWQKRTSEDGVIVNWVLEQTPCPKSCLKNVKYRPNMT